MQFTLEMVVGVAAALAVGAAEALAVGLADGVVD
ncbi:unannotated protein [freshwater metagenome]|uniref:Unannotated protein n=1 Tax=freshwater metagenome TaxID=449393 RepID=A0A6J7VLG6_9ZZZZ